MRVTITIHEATHEDVYDATLALQRTSGFPKPVQRNEGFEPQVRVAGTVMVWESPYVYPVQVPAFWREFELLQAERAQWAKDRERIMLERFHEHTCLDGAHIKCRRVLGLHTSADARVQ